MVKMASLSTQALMNKLIMTKVGRRSVMAELLKINRLTTINCNVSELHALLSYGFNTPLLVH